MVYADCAPTPIVGGLFFTVFGVFFAYAGFYALFKPDSKKAQDLWVNQYYPEAEADRFSLFMRFTREHAGVNNLALGRFLGPLIGTIFTLAGLWMTVSWIHCGAHLPYVLALFGPLAWHALEGTYVALMIFGVGIGVWNGHRMRPVLREVYISLLLFSGVAAAQAAAFHVGPQAPRWFALAVLSGALSAGVFKLNGRLAKAKALST